MNIELVVVSIIAIAVAAIIVFLPARVKVLETDIRGEIDIIKAEIEAEAAKAKTYADTKVAEVYKVISDAASPGDAKAPAKSGNTTPTK